MNPSTLRRIIDELSALLAARSTELAEQPRLHPVNIYKCADLHDRERHELFRGHPLVAGYAEELSNPGDFVTREIVGVPILMVRDRSGAIRAFLNVCRHRGNVVCESPAGNAKAFVCQYHGWVYGNDGTCRSFGHPTAFDGCSLNDFALRRLPVEVRHGLVWVLLTPGQDLSVEAFLGPTLDDELAGFAGSCARVFAQRVTTHAFNWKLGVETFLEIFHISTLHRTSIAAHFLDGLMTSEKLGSHYRITAARPSFADVAMKSASEWALTDHCVFIYLLFPNTVYLFQREHVQVYSFFPGRHPGECQVRTALLRPDGRVADRATRHWQNNWDLISQAVYDEDFRAMERVQRGISAGASDGFIFGRNESVLQAYHEEIRRCLGASSPHSVRGTVTSDE